MSDWKFSRGSRVNTRFLNKKVSFKYLPNFILRCLKRSANASSSLGSVSWSGCKLAAATAAAIAEWCDPEKWQFEKSFHNIKLSISKNFSIKGLFSKRSHQVCVHSMVPRDDDDSSYGSYYDKIREAGGVMMKLAFLTLVLVLSWNQLDLPSDPSSPSRASETYFSSK